MLRITVAKLMNPKYLRYLITVLLMVVINGCGQNDSQGKVTVTKDALSAPLPGLLVGLALDETNLIVEVIIDGGVSQSCRNLSVDTVAGSFSCEITLAKGSHTLALVYYSRDATYGKVQLSSTSAIDINIVGGEPASADFGAATLSYDDGDKDGISNLEELDEGSDPTEPSYYVGGTVSGLDGEIILQLNGGNNLIVSDNGSFNFLPATQNTSAYTVAVLTQPNDPAQTCKVTNGSGTVNSARVTAVTVTCANAVSDVAVKLTSPRDNGFLAGSIEVMWDNLDPSPARVRILLSEDEGANFDIEIANVLNTGSFTWDTRSIQDGSNDRIRLVAVDQNGVEGGVSENSGNFIIDNTPPVVTIASPGKGQIVQGTNTNIAWSTADANPNLITLQLSDDGGQSFSFDLADGINDTGVYPFDATAYPDGTNMVLRIIARDKAGNVSEPGLSDVMFTISNSTPAVRPQVSGTALYQDVNFNNLVDKDDKLIVPFSQSIQINDVQASDFNLPVSGDTLGQLPVFEMGAAPNELVITLGQGAILTIKGNSDSRFLQVGGSSGIDVSNTVSSGAITSENGLTLAQSSTPIDVFPGFVQSSLLRVCPTSGISIGDINNDGFADIAQACDDTTVGTIIHINDKNGSFIEGPQLAPNLANGVKLADINNDGFLDVIEINRAATAATTYKASVIYINDKNGGFTFSQDLGVDSHTAYGLAVGDIDNDQDLDLIIGRYNLPSFVYINNDSILNQHAIEIPATKLTQVYLQHVNGDGTLDLIIAGHNRFDHIIYTGNGDGTFTELQRINNPVSGAYMAFEPLNNDVFVDMVLAVSGQANQVFYNDGNGGFVDAGKPFGTSSPFGVALIDIDGDSDFDVVEGTDFNAPGLVWINNGDEVFVDSGARLASRQTRAMDVGDLDNDGDLDIVFGNAYQNSAVWKSSSATP